jgi:HD-GYP domain-containing protein (c-di-GMP phosphodiesterase class II)
MTFPRSYAPQLTVAQTIEELRRCAGTQFDAAVVDALSELVVELLWPATTTPTATGRADASDPAGNRSASR